MKRWISLAAALYPRSWRELYGTEFDALLDDVKPRWRVFANVLGGAITMQMKNGTSWMKLMAATAALGAIVSGWMSYRVPLRYESSALVGVTPQPDPLRPASPQVLRQRALQRFMQSASRIQSRQGLAAIINDPSLNLYPAERRRTPLEDVENEMRRNIHIEARLEARPSQNGGLNPLVFGVTFSYPDKAKAQATVRVLTGKLSEENRMMTLLSANSYNELWRAVHLAKPVPAPPPGDVVGVLDAPSLPKQAPGPNRLAFVASGLGAGLLFGLLAALTIRHPRGARKLAGFALVGFVLAAAASFLIPNRFTATAVMEVVPPVLTEDPLAPLPPATSAAEFLRQIEPAVLSPENLSRIVEDPRLKLHSDSREIARDIRIAPLSPGSGAFSISFSYRERKTAVDTVNALISFFIQESVFRVRQNADRMTVIQREIESRRAAEYLDVIDAPTVPPIPESPSRSLVALAGLGAGLLIGAFSLRLRQPIAAGVSATML